MLPGGRLKLSLYRCRASSVEQAPRLEISIACPRVTQTSTSLTTSSLLPCLVTQTTLAQSKLCNDFFRIAEWFRSIASRSCGAWEQFTASHNNSHRSTSRANKLFALPRSPRSRFRTRAIQLHLVNSARDLTHRWSRLHPQLQQMAA